ncbi:polysaccharide deacetylase family protein [Carboxylicivirga sp. A043]|uniref:polysaccharide deacetylase family protein n=1 Tax=Carboxylicivirga litoralis TaxID=2816963 RepID=UPI0021CAEA6A|nr:polysaccharide deacetylase family protein [Carboxylicivirga sp. A043]MCU4156682.1 polysaccharide deacetylase family protein [Carboxylicivirga sp. A043]
MQKALNQNQLDYVLFHLNQHIDLTDEIKETICYSDNLNINNKLIFKPSNSSISLNNRIDYNGESIPCLFPVDDKQQWFDQVGDSVIFYQDILKSAFYLLSAYQEYNSESVDHMGRFQYKDSIQEQLQIIQKPIVNYYFEIISDGIELFCQINNIAFQRKRLFDNYGFMLTHDVDRVDYFHWRETAYKVMQLLGLKKAHYDKKRLAKATFDALLPTFFPGYTNDPWWNFKELRRFEKSLKLKSTWYFLNRDGSPHDAKYNLEEPRIKQLVFDLESEGCEVGLHGSIKTASDAKAMKKAKQRFEKIANKPIVGTRQHFLKFNYACTLKVQQENGLLYDTSMGFAEHDGFRTSYCYPFKAYDHTNDQMMDIWEFPLTIMDTTLFGYRKLNYNEMQYTFQQLTEEIAKFGGLMVMLWHNCNFDEYENPGIKDYYNTQLQTIVNTQPESVTGKDVLQKLP